MRRTGNAQVPDVVDEGTRDEILTTSLVTHNGQRLSPKEDRFITLYIKYADAKRAAEEAGYAVRPEIKNKDAQYVKKGKELLMKDYIKDEISARMDEFRDAQIADTKEVLIYLSNVMRGKEKDQFGLDVSIADRTNAAKELNRRLKEIEDAIQTILHIHFLQFPKRIKEFSVETRVVFQTFYGYDVAFEKKEVDNLQALLGTTIFMLVILLIVVTANSIVDISIYAINPNALTVILF